MTLAEIRQGVRDLTKIKDDEAGTVLPSNNTLLDFYLNWATELVVLDLVEFIPKDFLTYEDISLVANDNENTLTAGWLQIWAMLYNITDKKRRVIPYFEATEQLFEEYAGETAAEPTGWTLKGQTIVWLPTPSAAYANYARCWIVASEAATMVTAGPVYIPRQAHRLIIIYSAILIGTMNDWDLSPYEKIYGHMLKKARDTLGFRVQQQPRFLKPSFTARQLISSKDPAYHDLTDFF